MTLFKELPISGGMVDPSDGGWSYEPFSAICRTGDNSAVADVFGSLRNRIIFPCPFSLKVVLDALNSREFCINFNWDTKIMDWVGVKSIRLLLYSSISRNKRVGTFIFSPYIFF